MMLSSTMTEDWYTTWLGLAPGPRPPDYYTLLALPRFTDAPRAIEAAARAQMEKLDPYAMHPDRERRETSTGLMNEIAQARVVLVDPEKRRAYNRELAEKLGIDPPVEGDSTQMGETIAGGAPVGLADLDIAAIAAAEASAGHIEAPTDVVPESLFKNQAPLQDMDASYSRSRRHNVIPFGAVIAVVIGVVIIAVVGIAIAVIVMSSGNEQAANHPAPAPTPSDVTDVAPTPAAPPRFEFHDLFDRAQLGRNYEIRSGDPKGVAIRDGKLELSAGDESTVRVDLTPRRSGQMFSEAAAVVTIEKGASFSFGIASTARITITSHGAGEHGVRVSPGSLVNSSDSSGTLKLSGLDVLRMRLQREAGSIYWYINEAPVATSPDLPPRGTPMIELRAEGGPGLRCEIDEVHVFYDADAQSR